MAAWRAEAAHLGELVERATRIGGDVEGAERMGQVANRVMVADLYWVSADMTRAALDASQDVPAIAPSEAPLQGWLLACAEPLPAAAGPGGLALRDTSSGSLAIRDHRDPDPVDALAWMPWGDQGLRVVVLARSSRLPLPLMATPAPSTGSADEATQIAVMQSAASAADDAQLRQAAQGAVEAGRRMEAQGAYVNSTE